MKRLYELPQTQAHSAILGLPTHGRAHILKIAICMQFPEASIDRPITLHNSINPSEWKARLAAYRIKGLTDKEWDRILNEFSKRMAEKTARRFLPSFTEAISAASNDPGLFLRITENVDLEAVMKRIILPGAAIHVDECTTFTFDENFRLKRVEQRCEAIYQVSGFNTMVDKQQLDAAKDNWEEGMSLDECITSYFSPSTRPARLAESPYSYIDRLITKVEKPQFEREPENTDKKTFDRVRIEANVNSMMFGSWDELVASLRENKKAIDEMILRAISKSKGFAQYGIPINCLKLAEARLGRNHTLEYIFELKRF